MHNSTDLRAVLIDTRLRVDLAIERLDAGDHELVLDLVSGACIRLHDARAVARFLHEAHLDAEHAS